MSADPERWIVVRNWGRFQHLDATKRGRDPVWIKVYTRLHSDDAFLGLSGHRRGVLLGIWIEYARSGGRLRHDTRTISRRLNLKVTTADLEALSHAGFLAFRQDTVTPREEENREETQQRTGPRHLREAAEAAEENLPGDLAETALEMTATDDGERTSAAPVAGETEQHERVAPQAVEALLAETAELVLSRGANR